MHTQPASRIVPENTTIKCISAVDLANLRLFTDGDRAMELQFVDLFFNGAEPALETMKTHCADGESNEWSEAAHALKGNAANLGAEALRALCEQAQDALRATADQRKALLQAIELEMQNVKTFLQAEGILPERWR